LTFYSFNNKAHHNRWPSEDGGQQSATAKIVIKDLGGTRTWKEGLGRKRKVNTYTG